MLTRISSIRRHRLRNRRGGWIFSLTPLPLQRMRPEWHHSIVTRGQAFWHCKIFYARTSFYLSGKLRIGRKAHRASSLGLRQLGASSSCLPNWISNELFHQGQPSYRELAPKIG